MCNNSTNVGSRIRISELTAKSASVAESSISQFLQVARVTIASFLSSKP